MGLPSIGSPREAINARMARHAAIAASRQTCRCASVSRDPRLMASTGVTLLASRDGAAAEKMAMMAPAPMASPIDLQLSAIAPGRLLVKSADTVCEISP